MILTLCDDPEPDIKMAEAKGDKEDIPELHEEDEYFLHEYRDDFDSPEWNLVSEGVK